MTKPRYCILWVEDDPRSIMAVVAKLREHGVDVCHAKSREDACNILDDGQRFDLVVLDELMPETEHEDQKSGYLLFLDLRNDRWSNWGKNVPVIFVTNYSEIVRGLIAGMVCPPNDIIDKPLPPQVGVAHIVKHLTIVIKNSKCGDIHLNGSGAATINTLPALDADAYEKLEQLEAMLKADPRSHFGEGGRLLGTIREARGDTQNTDIAVRRFRDWVSSCADEVKEGIADAANLVQIGGAVLAILGIV